MSVTTCTYCNATVTVPAPMPANRRTECPRCGETVLFQEGDIGRELIAPVSRIAVESRQLTNRRIAGYVLAFMAVMAAISLGYALRTVEFRRANDKIGLEPDRPPISSIVPVTELMALSFLQDDAQVIAAARVADGLQTTFVRNTLTRSGISPNGDELVLGVRMEDLDHVASGVSFKLFPPRVILVLRTRTRLDVDTVRKASGTGRSISHGGRTLHSAKLGQAGPEGLIWFADEFTLVAALVKEHFDTVPASRKKGVSRFTGLPPDLIADRVPADAVAFAAGQIDPANATQTLILDLVPVPANEKALLSQVREFALSARAEPAKLAVRVDVRGADDNTTSSVAAAVAQWFGAATSPKRDGAWSRIESTIEPPSRGGRPGK